MTSVAPTHACCSNSKLCGLRTSKSPSQTSRASHLAFPIAALRCSVTRTSFVNDASQVCERRDCTPFTSTSSRLESFVPGFHRGSVSAPCETSPSARTCSKHACLATPHWPLESASSPASVALDAKTCGGTSRLRSATRTHARWCVGHVACEDDDDCGGRWGVG